VLSALVLLFAGGCDRTVRTARAPDRISADRIHQTMRSVRAYQLDKLRTGAQGRPRGWRYCTFFAGMMAAYRATGEPAYRDSTRAWAERHDWELGRDKQDPNDHCVGQVYAELYAERPHERRLENTRAVLKRVIGRGESGTEMWDWVDALFMAPPALARLAEVTNTPGTFDFVARRFREASRPLFDSTHGLYYRDIRFKDWTASNGRPVFWARGNGWVVAGIVRVLQSLPSGHPARPWFERRFRTLAASIAAQQQRSGFWRPSLLDPTDVPSPETSGTGLFCYAFAWGVNEGLLNRRRYAPVARNAWRALAGAVRPDGRLAWVQPPHSRPAPVAESDTYPYGSGALLLAGSQVLQMMET
jgi:rhamnogalacturonyl hydrolase YesR